MKNYDVIIIGSGGGTKLRPVSDMGKKVAVIEKDKAGGTCLNRGCIPSKMVIHPADVADEIRHAHRFDINVDTNISVNFQDLIKRVTTFTDGESQSIIDAYSKKDNVDYYHGEGRFVSEKVVEVNGEQLTADYIFIATGARPFIPNIEGLADTPYMTSTEALRNTKQPKKLIVIGGGYIGVELGHFFGGLGTEVHFLVRNELLGQMDSEVRTEFQRVFSEKYNVHLGHTPTCVRYDGENFHIFCETKDGQTSEISGDGLLVATGVVPNSDTLSLENTSIKVNERGFIEVDENLSTGVDGVYALGDVVGNYMFRHSVNFEGEYLIRTLFIEPSNEPINYPPMPYAVFSNPQVGGVGKTEDELQKEGIEYFKGVNPYSRSAMGDALRSDHGFVKLLFDKSTEKLIGAHIIGPEASNMIHMLIAFMNMNACLSDLLRTIYIHPALPENVRNAARRAKANLQQMQ